MLSSQALHFCSYKEPQAPTMSIPSHMIRKQNTDQKKCVKVSAYKI